MPDLQTLLSKFLADLYSGVIGSGGASVTIRTADGSKTAPAYAFISDTGTGLYRSASGTVQYATGGVGAVQLYGSGLVVKSDSFIGFTSGTDTSASSADAVLFRDAANVIAQKNGTSAQALRLYQTTTGPVSNTLHMTAPTISSGFGTSPSIVAGSTAFAFRVNVGTGGVATSGVIGMPTATNGWQAIVQDMTNNTATRVTATTTNSITITAAAAWAASDILVVIAVAF